MNALIVVDLQNDFCPGGALAIDQGDAVIPAINGIMPLFDIVVATQDWHPPDHCSFAENHPGKEVGDTVKVAGLKQELWPVHCVQHTPRAAFHPALSLEPIQQSFKKGTDPEIDSYSTFFDNAHRRSTGLSDYLAERTVNTVFLAGLATDYCVKFSALDALELGFSTTVIADATRAVNLAPEDGRKAIDDMRAKGARIVTCAQIADELT